MRIPIWLGLCALAHRLDHVFCLSRIAREDPVLAKLYFVDWNNPGNVYRTTAPTLPNFQSYKPTLATQHLVNDVKKIVVNGKAWYLMGLHYNSQSIWDDGLGGGCLLPAETFIWKSTTTVWPKSTAIFFWICDSNPGMATLTS